jgi:hypothetical protein
MFSVIGADTGGIPAEPLSAALTWRIIWEAMRPRQSQIGGKSEQEQIAEAAQKGLPGLSFAENPTSAFREFRTRP